MALEAELAPGVHYLVPFSIGGTGIVAGRFTMVAVTDPVRHLMVTAFTDYATVSWEWPASAELAEITWELDGEMDSMLISRSQYRSAGGARVPLGRGPCRIEVRAVIMVGDASFTAPPAGAVVDNVVDVAINYTISALSVGPFGGRSKKVVFTAAQGCANVQVRMIASPGRVMPTSASHRGAPAGGNSVATARRPGRAPRHRAARRQAPVLGPVLRDRWTGPPHRPAYLKPQGDVVPITVCPFCFRKIDSSHLAYQCAGRGNVECKKEVDEDREEADRKHGGDLSRPSCHRPGGTLPPTARPAAARRNGGPAPAVTPRCRSTSSTPRAR